jgi:hypothetical protein
MDGLYSQEMEIRFSNKAERRIGARKLYCCLDPRFSLARAQEAKLGCTAEQGYQIDAATLVFITQFQTTAGPGFHSGGVTLGGPKANVQCDRWTGIGKVDLQIDFLIVAQVSVHNYP